MTTPEKLKMFFLFLSFQISGFSENKNEEKCDSGSIENKKRATPLICFPYQHQKLLLLKYLMNPQKMAQTKKLNNYWETQEVIRNHRTWRWSHKIGKDLKEDNIKEMDISEKRTTIEKKWRYPSLKCWHCNPSCSLPMVE